MSRPLLLHLAFLIFWMAPPVFCQAGNTDPAHARMVYHPSTPPAGAATVSPDQTHPALAVPFSGGYGQVEVGGVYAGAEFHDSRPLPSRLSFYTPVANSLDLSTDYWKRGDSRPMVLAVRLDGGRPYLLGKEPWEYTVGPHRVEFRHVRDGLSYTLAYDFCRTLPAMAMRLTVRNMGTSRRTVALYTHVVLALRSCQTFARFDSSDVRLASSGDALVASFRERQLDRASLFVLHQGARPVRWWTDAAELSVRDSGWAAWVEKPDSVFEQGSAHDQRHRGLAAGLFERTLTQGDSLAVIALIGTCSSGETGRILEELRKGWEEDIMRYGSSVEGASHLGIRTGCADIDSSAVYARGVVAANRHYIDGTVVPMPCPAEYNFFFTHDVLLTGLATSLYDPPQVRRDLQFIVSHASGDTIPHAYYWRDDGFKTELCTPDNWNHLWFILLNGWYLRHSGDTITALRLYPYVTRSLGEILSQRGSDGLMHAFRPDWWDIGRSEGPRSFITILTIRALEEYCALSTVLHRNLDRLNGYARAAAEMRGALPNRLWDDGLGYLINYNGAVQDRHLYMVSLLAPAFRQLGADTARLMLRSAAKSLLAPKVGIRTVFPVDFNSDSAIRFFKFAGNEAGDPFVYANGGVWQHCNAWYAIGLQQNGLQDSALDFYRQAMTISGVMHSPMGQPAMYEYRFSDPASPEYGRIDKPSFLWAGGFSLFTLYHLLGVRDDPWNVSIGNGVPGAFTETAFVLAFGDSMRVVQHGTGPFLQRCVIDGKPLASRVLPADVRGARNAEVFLGARPGSPVLDEVFALLHHVSYDERTRIMTVAVQGFDGQDVLVKGTSPARPRKAGLDGVRLRSLRRTPRKGGQEWTLSFRASGKIQSVQIQF